MLWPTLAWFDLDLAGLEDVEEKGALEQLLPYRGRKPLSRHPSEVVHLTPDRDDAALEAVMHLVTRTVGWTGLAATGSEIVYDVNDAGVSCAFRLTAAQFVDIEGRLNRRGLPPGLLVALRQTIERSP